jgi:hypothetical protein
LLSVIYKDKKNCASLLPLSAILFAPPPSPVDEGSEIMEPTGPITRHSIPAPKTFLELVQSKETSPRFNRKTLSRFLKQFSVFPEDHRVLIWRFILGVPENHDAYEVR